MFSFFKSKAQIDLAPLKTDIHSHLLPQLDDGVKSLEESGQLIRQFIDLGYTKLITTPHVMNDFYRNEPNDIIAKLELLKKYLKSESINIPVEAAAEYYLDESLIERIKKGEKLLTFGANFLLFETNFITEPFQLKEFIFSVTTLGYKPVLAHPERYQYLVNNFLKVEDLKNRGVLFQLNIPSIIGAYSKPTQKLAIQLIEKGWIDFMGSDCHNQIQMDVLKETFKNKHFKKALALPLLNRSL
ncbi:MAG: capsular biosynthesis protein [Cyclobacteriaceae bacterium]|nr:capsular biosynthesis protein [Cyclobacteriaceae bacterium]